jgi:superfamily II DNA/RNA helicase
VLHDRPREEEKLAALLALVRDVIPAGRPTLIFASTRHHVDLLAQLLAAEGIPATFVYGTLDQARPRRPAWATWKHSGAGPSCYTVER